MSETTETRWIDRKVGGRFLVHVGGSDYVAGTKVAHDTFRKDDGREIKVSAWTKTRDAAQ